MHIARSGHMHHFASVCLSVCLGVPRAHYTPLQRYMAYLCTRKAQYAPLRRNMHHGAQGTHVRVGDKSPESVCLSVCLSEYWSKGFACVSLVAMGTGISNTGNMVPQVCCMSNMKSQPRLSSKCIHVLVQCCEKLDNWVWKLIQSFLQVL